MPRGGKTRARCRRDECIPGFVEMIDYLCFDAMSDSKRLKSSSSCHSRRAFSLAARKFLHAGDDGSDFADSPAHAGANDL
jgi:hypothetical protein